MKKAKMNMRKLLLTRIGEAVIFLGIVAALGIYMVNHFSFSAHFISAAILNVFSVIGLIGSISQITLIILVDYTAPILKVQRRIAKVQSHGIQLLRLHLLSVPFYLAYIFLGWELLLGFDLFSHMDPTWFTVQITFSALLILPTLWVIRELDKQTPKYKWLRHLRQNAAGRPAVAAFGLLNELHTFKTDR